MSPDARDLVTWVLGTVTSLAVLTGLVVRFALLPYLRDKLVQPVAEVHKQVSENHHSNASPTLPDRIDDVHLEVMALARVLEGHLNSSDRWIDHLIYRLEALEDRGKQKPAGHVDPSATRPAGTPP